MSCSFAMFDPDSIAIACGQARPPVALIAGPTAGGKSAVALQLSEMTNGVVINADASQVYADLAILSARPDDADLVRAEHRLFGHIDGAQACSAAHWAAEARDEIRRCHREGRLPILVGGTGLYLDTLLHGIAPVPDIAPAIRETVRSMRVDEAYAALAVEDPEAAGRLNAGDTTRVARALEVVRSTGRPISAWQQQREGGIAASISLCPMVVIRPRADLAARAEQRLDMMLSGGALEEVERLIARNLPANLPVMRALGVREIAALLSGTLPLDDTRTLILKQTIAYQKRQLTWARGRQSDWPRIDPDQALADQLGPIWP